jgi:hypothetical protein
MSFVSWFPKKSSSLALRFLNIWQIIKVQTLGKYVLSSEIFSMNKMKNYFINIIEFRPWEQNTETQSQQTIFSLLEQYPNSCTMQPQNCLLVLMEG